jgi:glycine oxidase
MDAVVVGGGIIGLSSALALAESGLSVTVIDRGDPGAQASWAAAGILGPQSELQKPSPMLELMRFSFRLYPEWTAKLGEVGFRANGTLHLAFSEEEAGALDAMRRWQTAHGLRVEERRHDRARLALFFPDEGQVENRGLLQALKAACRRAGVELRHAAVGSLADIEAKHVVLCAGSWSGQLAPVRVFPVRGEMIALETPPPECVVFGAGGYLIPRGRRMLVGATAERAGFDSAPTRAGRSYLLDVASRLQPGSERAPLLDHWAGLRPGTPDGLPIFGVLPGGVIAATGHFRNGILLAPVTALIVRALVRGEPPPLDLAPFRPER